jgi:hypothetical protein
MTTSANTSLYAKTTRQFGAGFGMRTARVGSPVAIAITGGAAITHGFRTSDVKLHAHAARCAG